MYKILIIDDNELNISQFRAILEKDYIVVTEKNPMQVRASILVQKPDVILLNVNLKEFSGIDLCERIVRDILVPNIPIIFISNDDDERNIVKCFNAGAAEVICPPFKPYEVKARVLTHIKM